MKSKDLHTLGYFYALFQRKDPSTPLRSAQDDTLIYLGANSSNYNLSSSRLSCIGHECRFVDELVAHWLPALLALSSCFSVENWARTEALPVFFRPLGHTVALAN